MPSVWGVTRSGFTVGTMLKRYITVIWGFVALLCYALYHREIKNSDLVWGHATRDLCDLQGMGEAGTEHVAFVVDEDLRLVLKPSKSRTMDDPISIPLELTAPTWRWLGMQAAAGSVVPHGVSSQSLVYLHHQDWRGSAGGLSISSSNGSP